MRLSQLFTIICDGLTTCPKMSLLSFPRKGEKNLARLQNVQEVATDRTHENAPDAGAGYRAPCGSLDGLQHLESEAYPALGGRPSCLRARLFPRAEDRGKEKLGEGERLAHARP